MAKFAKWIGGGLGWVLGGPIGGILGFVFGSVVDSLQVTEAETLQTQPGDFSVSLLVLAAAVIRADEKVMKSELDFIRAFFIQQFGPVVAEQKMNVLNEILKHEINVYDVSRQIRQYMDYPSRLQLLHFLFGVAAADNFYHPREVEMIGTISGYLGISAGDYESIRAMFIKDTTSAYRILEIEPGVSDEDIKKAYRRMAVKYHPDKVSHLGEDVQKAANAKFQEVNAAYAEIKRQRGFN